MNRVDYKKLVWLSAVVAIITVLVFVNVQHFVIGLNINTFGMIGTIAGINWFLWELFKKWLWKLPIFRHWLVMIPNLNGNWEGALQSTWVDEKTGKIVDPIDTKAVIKQDLTTITIDFTTNEMDSRSIIAEISCDPHRRVVEINYTYQSDPDATVKHRSAIHYGSAKLVYGKTSRSETLKGDYWTDRKTTGTIVIKRSKK